MSEADKSLVDKIGVDTVLIIIDLILTTLVAVITTMRFRAKCGKVECACKPKDQSRSPGSVDSPAAAAALAPLGGGGGGDSSRPSGLPEPVITTQQQAPPQIMMQEQPNDHSSSTVSIVITSPRPGGAGERSNSVRRKVSDLSTVVVETPK